MAGMRFGLVMLAALLLSSSATLAQQPSGNPCAGDIKKLCAGIQPGDGRIKACIKSNLTGLSETCEERLLSVAVAGKVCKGDVAKRGDRARHAAIAARARLSPRAST